MLVCTPTSDANGLDSKIHNHFGSTPYFTLYNTDTEEVQILENRNAHHSHGTCHPMNQLEKYKIDVVLCNSLGRRAIEALNFEGIRTLGTDNINVMEALKLSAEDKLSDFDPSHACRGHGQNVEPNEIGHSIECNDGRPMRGNGRNRRQGNRQGSRNRRNG